MNKLIKTMALAAALTVPCANALILPDAPSMQAKGFILMDYNSGHIIAQNNADAILAPASLTKLMTAYVVGQEINSKHMNWDDPVTVSRNAWSAKFDDSSKMFIKPGDKVNVKQLMMGLIVQSGNDASVALAEHVAGDHHAFVSLMNAWAKTIGMKDTNFINAHGLDGDGIATTAQDMALLMQAVIRDTPDVYKLYDNTKFTWNGITQYNRNRLLTDQSLNVDGGKTGYTGDAGYSLVASATKEEMRLISVVMGAKNPTSRQSGTKQLFTYGFRFFDTIKITGENEEVTKAKVWKGDLDEVSVVFKDETYVTMPRSEIDKMKKHLVMDTELMAPINKGDVIGSVEWTVDEEVVKKIDVISDTTVERGSFFKRLLDTLRMWFGSMF